MNENTKDINITHLKRPAVAVVKKPLLSTDEMTYELTRLLNYTLPTLKQYIHYGGIFRAIIALIHPTTNAIITTRYIDTDHQLYIRKMHNNDPETARFGDLYFDYACNYKKTAFVRTDKNNILNTQAWITKVKQDEIKPEDSIQSTLERSINNYSMDQEALLEEKYVQPPFKYRLYLFLNADQDELVKAKKANFSTYFLDDYNTQALYLSDTIFASKPTQVVGKYTNGKQLLHSYEAYINKSVSGPTMPKALRGYFTERSLRYHNYSAYIWEFSLNKDYLLLQLPKSKVQGILDVRSNKLRDYEKQLEDLNKETDAEIKRMQTIYKVMDLIDSAYTEQSLYEKKYGSPRNRTAPGNINQISPPDTYTNITTLLDEFNSRSNTYQLIPNNTVYLEGIGVLSKELLEAAYDVYITKYSGKYDKYYNDTITSYIKDNNKPPTSMTELYKTDFLTFPSSLDDIKKHTFPLSLDDIKKQTAENIIEKKLERNIKIKTDYKVYTNEITEKSIVLADNIRKWVDNYNKNTTDPTKKIRFIDNTPILNSKLIKLLAKLYTINNTIEQFNNEQPKYSTIYMLYNKEITLNTTPSKITVKSKKDTEKISTLDFKTKYYLLLYQKISNKIKEKYQYFIDTGVAHLVPGDLLSYIDNIYSKKQQIQDKISFCRVMENILFSPWSGIYLSTDKNNYNLLYNITPTKSMFPDSFNNNTNDNYVDTIINSRNDDISQISISRAANGPSSASVSIKNKDDKYMLVDTNYTREKYYQHIGTSIIEEMDEIFLYLPKYYMANTSSNTLELCFRGLVSSVDYQTDNGYRTISVKATCPIKYLDMSKTNIKPSFSINESKQFNNAVPYHIWSIPPSFLTNMTKALSWILTQSLSCIFCQPKPVADSDTTEQLFSYETIDNPLYNTEEKKKIDKYNKTKKPNEAAKTYEQPKFISRIRFKDPLFTYLWYVNNTVADKGDQVVLQRAYEELCELYTTTDYFNPKENKLDKVTGVITAQDINGTTVYMKSPSISIYKYRSDVSRVTIKQDKTLTVEKQSDFLDPYLVGRLTGTGQPAYNFSTATTDARISQYKTNKELIQEAVDKWNYAFYSDKNGVVTITPLNTSLLNLNIPIYQGKSDVDYVKLFTTSDKLDTTEKYNPFVLTKERVIKYTKSRDDSKVINWLQVNGEVPIASELNKSQGNLAIVKSQPLINRYGVRAQKTYPLLGAQSALMCYIYGLAMMDRQNKLIESADIEALGDASIDVNNSLYCTADNTVYYIDGIRMSYSPGKTFTMNLSCSYGRKPLIALAEYIKGGYKRADYETVEDEESIKYINYDDLIQNKSLVNYLYLFDIAKLRVTCKELLTNDKIPPMTWIQLNGALDSTESRDEKITNKDVAKTKCFLECTLPTIAFNGYIYDYIPSILMEDLIYTQVSMYQGANIGNMFLLVSDTSTSNNSFVPVMDVNSNIEYDSNNKQVIKQLDKTAKPFQIAEAYFRNYSSVYDTIHLDVLQKYIVEFVGPLDTNGNKASAQFLESVRNATPDTKDIEDLSNKYI